MLGLVTYKLCWGRRRGTQHPVSMLSLQSWGSKQDCLLTTFQSSPCIISRFIVSHGNREKQVYDFLFRPEITVQLLIISNCVFFFFFFPGEGPLYLRNWKKVS